MSEASLELVVAPEDAVLRGLQDRVEAAKDRQGRMTFPYSDCL